MKSAKQRQNEYDIKYKYIPTDTKERLAWMCEEYKIDSRLSEQILRERERRLNNMYYTMIKIVLYQIPQGAKRPRFRIINRRNILNEAKLNPSFIHVYSPDASYNHNYMERIIDENKLENLNQLICTPCDVNFMAYFPTPTSYNKVDTFMAELGLIRPITKPDFDNISKLYSDMYNSNVWLDDCLTIRGCCDKLYSILPRVEIELYYLNGVYNKAQYNNIINRKDFDQNTMSLRYI